MGLCQEFVCLGCGYAAIVSGGDDCGMVATTTTVTCQQCRELFDVVTSALDGDGVPLEGTPFRKVQVRCPRRRTHSVTAWTFPGTCPRCAAMMDKKIDGQMLLWD